MIIETYDKVIIGQKVFPFQNYIFNLITVNLHKDGQVTQLFYLSPGLGCIYASSHVRSSVRYALLHIHSSVISGNLQY